MILWIGFFLIDAILKSDKWYPSEHLRSSIKYLWVFFLRNGTAYLLLTKQWFILSGPFKTDCLFWKWKNSSDLICLHVEALLKRKARTSYSKRRVFFEKHNKAAKNNRRNIHGMSEITCRCFFEMNISDTSFVFVLKKNRPIEHSLIFNS